MIKLSIIIPTYNKLNRLRVVLKSLEKQIRDDMEVIIVFDGCTPSVIKEFFALSFAFKPKAVVCEKNIGRAAARNRGLELARGDIIVFLDDDRIVHPNYIKAHLKSHEEANGPCVVLGARHEIFLNDREIELMDGESESINKICRRPLHSHEYPYRRKENDLFRWINFFTGNVSVDKKSLEHVGCFDEWFVKWGGEDNDLGIRLCLKGVSYIYNDDAINYHMMHDSNFTNQSEQCLTNIKYMMKKYKKHPIILMGLLMMYLPIRHHGIYIPSELKKIYEEEKQKEQMQEVISK